MMNLKKLGLGLLASLSMLSVVAQKRMVELSGNITGLAGREVAIFGNGNYTTPIVKTNGKGDSFKIDMLVELDESVPYYLNIPAIGDFGRSMKMPYFMLFLDGAVMTVDATITADSIIRLNGIKGSAFMEEYNRLERENEYSIPLQKAVKTYNDAFDTYNRRGETTDANRKLLEESSELIDAMQNKMGDSYLEMISDNATSKALAFHVHRYFSDAPLTRKKQIISLFDTSIHNCYPIISLMEGVRLEEGSTVGNPLPDFDTYTVDGKLDKLSNYKGQYLLIDFWASWCGPCIAEMPNLKSVYNDYKDKGLKLIGISLDDSQEKWEKGIKDQNLTYLQLRDTHKKTATLLNYQGVPFIILVSPEGKIIERDLRGEEIRNKVKQYLD